jgi:hypothetical protein
VPAGGGLHREPPGAGRRPVGQQRPDERLLAGGRCRPVVEHVAKPGVRADDPLEPEELVLDVVEAALLLSLSDVGDRPGVLEAVGQVARRRPALSRAGRHHLRRGRRHAVTEDLADQG